MSVNVKQVAYWNEIAGPKWVGLHDAMKRRLAGVDDLLLDYAAPAPGEHVLDVGCGTGVTSAHLADAVGPHGFVTAVDVSRPMLDVARARLAGRGNVALIEADAADHPFEGQFDLITSRFGVMFFEDPVAAFTNLRNSARPGGRLRCVAWAPIKCNPHWALPLAIAIDRLGPGKPRPPHAPGPLALDDPDYVADILGRAGFTDIESRIEPVLLRGAALDEEARLAATMGPAASFLEEMQLDDDARAGFHPAFREAIAGVVDAQNRLPATVHLIAARVN